MTSFALLWWLGCRIPTESGCADPHLWYAPDGSSDVYFGCTPPQGWVQTPPDLHTGTAETDTEPETDTDTVTTTDTDTDPPSTGGTADTGLVRFGPGDSADTAAPIDDSGDPPPPTGDSGPASTGDTGVEQDTAETGDTGIVAGDTAATGDTGLVAPPTDGDTGDTADTGHP